MSIFQLDPTQLQQLLTNSYLMDTNQIQTLLGMQLFGIGALIGAFCAITFGLFVRRGDW